MSLLPTPNKEGRCDTTHMEFDTEGEVTSEVSSLNGKVSYLCQVFFLRKILGTRYGSVDTRLI